MDFVRVQGSGGRVARKGIEKVKAGHRDKIN